MEKSLNILLADDDKDDRFFFNKVLLELPIKTRLKTVEDGALLMQYLSDNPKNLSDVLFLDLNMPKKNGAECLEEIKKNALLKHLPVVIYSTSLHEDIAEQLFTKGAHFYIKKSNISELKKSIFQVLTLMLENKFKRPKRSGFLLTATVDF